MRRRPNSSRYTYCCNNVAFRPPNSGGLPGSSPPLSNSNRGQRRAHPGMCELDRGRSTASASAGRCASRKATTSARNASTSASNVSCTALPRKMVSGFSEAARPALAIPLPYTRVREYYSRSEKVAISDTAVVRGSSAAMSRRSPVESNHVLPTRQSSDPPVTSPSEEPAWKQRAVERSIKTAKLRAAQRVQRFLDAAQAIIIEKGSTDFTVQEVVDRSRQSLRSFYLQFDGKHELLLALFEDALSRSADQIRAATEGHSDPLERLQVAVKLLFETSRSDPDAKRSLFTDFAPRLLVSHPAEVRVAHAPLHALLTELMEDASAAGQLRPGVNPRRMAAMTMQTVMFVAQQAAAEPDDSMSHPITADEVWDFCAHGFVGG